MDLFQPTGGQERFMLHYGHQGSFVFQSDEIYFSAIEGTECAERGVVSLTRKLENGPTDRHDGQHRDLVNVLLFKLPRPG